MLRCLFCLACLLLVAPSCTLKGPSGNTTSAPVPAPPAPLSPAQGQTPADANVTLKLADVESVQATYVAAPTPALLVKIKGLLNDGATRIHDIRQDRLTNGVTISVITARPRNLAATMALIPFERDVTVPLDGQPSGPFSISANGVATTVMVP